MISKGNEVRVANIVDLEARIQDMKDRANYIRETAAELFATISEVLEQGDGKGQVSQSPHDVQPHNAESAAQSRKRIKLTLVD